MPINRVWADRNESDGYRDRLCFSRPHREVERHSTKPPIHNGQRSLRRTQVNSTTGKCPRVAVFCYRKEPCKDRPVRLQLHRTRQKAKTWKNYTSHRVLLGHLLKPWTEDRCVQCARN